MRRELLTIIKLTGFIATVITGFYQIASSCYPDIFATYSSEIITGTFCLSIGYLTCFLLVIISKFISERENRAN
ncbi:hypothetical protein ABEW33_27380 [Priestia megaterium]